MNTKLLLGIIVGGVAAFLLGWLIFGIALMSYYEAHQNTYEGMMKESPNLTVLFIANLAYAAVLAMPMYWSKMVGMMKGGVIGAVMGGLVTFMMDMFFYAFMNLYKDTTIIVVDIVVNIIMGAVIGAIIGWLMGMGKKEAAPAA